MFSKVLKLDLFDYGLKKDEIVNLEGFSDIHKGGEDHKADLFEKRMNAVIDEDNRFTFYGGDMLDAITPKDKRWQRESVLETSLEQQKIDFYQSTVKLTKLHKKLKEKYGVGKVLWGLAGNHEYNNHEIDQTWIKSFFEGTVVEHGHEKGLAGLGVDYMGSRAMIGLEIQYKKKPLRRWTILSVHGFGGGANSYTPLQNLKFNHDADVYLMGHLHQKISMEEMKLKMDWKSGKAGLQKIILGNTGSFTDSIKEGFDQWFDRRNKLIPSSAGTITVSFDAYQGNLHHHI